MMYFFTQTGKLGTACLGRRGGAKNENKTEIYNFKKKRKKEVFLEVKKGKDPGGSKDPGSRQMST